MRVLLTPKNRLTNALKREIEVPSAVVAFRSVLILLSRFIGLDREHCGILLGILREFSALFWFESGTHHCTCLFWAKNQIENLFCISCPKWQVTDCSRQEEATHGEPNSCKKNLPGGDQLRAPASGQMTKLLFESTENKHFVQYYNNWEADGILDTDR